MGATFLSESLHDRFISRPSISEEVAQVLIETQEEEFEEHLEKVLPASRSSKEIPEALFLDKDQSEEEEMEPVVGVVVAESNDFKTAVIKEKMPEMSGDT